MYVFRPRPIGATGVRRTGTRAATQARGLQTQAGPPPTLPEAPPPQPIGGTTTHFTDIPRPMLRRARVVMPRPQDFVTPDSSQYDTTRLRAEMRDFRSAYDDPRGTAGFQTLLSLAGSRSARATEEATRRGQEVAGRRGYVGGYSGEGERVARETQRATATAGFEAADEIRRESGARYDAAAGLYANQQRAAADAINARNARYFDALTQARLAEAQAADAWQGRQTELYGAETRAASERGRLSLDEQRAREAQRQEQINDAERQRQYEREDAERQRQFNLEYDLRRREADLLPPGPRTFTDPYAGGTGTGGTAAGFSTRSSPARAPSRFAGLRPGRRP